MAIQDNVAARKAARQQDIPIENARPVTQPVLPTTRQTVRGALPTPVDSVTPINGSTSTDPNVRRQAQTDARNQRIEADKQFRGGDSGRDYDTSGANIDQSQLRINPRRAKDVNDQQSAKHRLQVDQNQVAAGRPSIYQGDEKASDEKLIANDILGGQTNKGGDTSKRVSDTAQNLAKQDKDERFKNAGIEGKGLGLAKILRDRGITSLDQISRGSFGSKMTLSNVDADFLKALQEAGLVDQVTADGSGDESKNNVVLKVGDREFNDLFDKFNFIDQGKDVDKAFSDVQERSQFDISSSFQEGGRQNIEQEKEAADSAAASSYIGSQMNQFMTSLQSASEGLAPEDQSYMGTLMQSLGDLESELNSSMSRQSGQASAFLNGGEIDLGNGQKLGITGTNTVANMAQKTLADIASRAIASKAQTDKILGESRDANEKYLQAQQQSQINSNVWQEQQQLQEVARQKTQRHDEMVAQLAISGGFGQEAGLRAVQASDTDFDKTMGQVRAQFGFKRTDIITNYVGLNIENENNYNNGIIANLKEMDGKLDTLSFKSIESEQARATAENTIVSNLFANVEKLRADKVKTTLSLTKEMNGLITADRKAKKESVDSLWDRYYQNSTLFGGNNPAAGQSILNQLGKLGVDVTGIDPSTATSAEINAARRLMFDQQKEFNDQNAGGQGKPLAGSDIEQLAGETSSIMSLIVLSKELADGKYDPTLWDLVTNPLGAVTGDSIGPVQGRVGALIPGSTTRKLKAKLARMRQDIGKAKEGGKLIGADEKKYINMLPKETDEPSLFYTKIDELQIEMKSDLARKINILKAQGYDTSGLGGDNIDPLYNEPVNQLQPKDAQSIMQSIESGEPITGTTGFLDTFMNAHVKREGYKVDPRAVTITAGNNPGALKWIPQFEQFGATKGKNNFAMFPDEASGYKALEFEITSKLRGRTRHAKLQPENNPTLFDYISIYAPSSDGNNPTSYGGSIVKALNKAGYNVDLNTPLSELSHYIS